MRYRLLETVRQYALDHLIGAGEFEVGRQRHAAWCAAFAEEAEPHLLRRRQVVWLSRLDNEHDNVRIALAWCLDNDVPLGLRIAAALWQFWRIRLYLGEGRQALTRLLDRSTDPTLVRARGLAAAGILAAWQVDAAAARALLEESATQARVHGDRALLGRVLRELGALVRSRFGDASTAVALYQEAIEHSRASDDRRSVATNLQQQARLAIAVGEFRQGQALLEESLPTAR